MTQSVSIQEWELSLTEETEEKAAVINNVTWVSPVASVTYVNGSIIHYSV